MPRRAGTREEQLPAAAAVVLVIICRRWRQSEYAARNTRMACLRNGGPPSPVVPSGLAVVPQRPQMFSVQRAPPLQEGAQCVFAGGRPAIGIRLEEMKACQMAGTAAG